MSRFLVKYRKVLFAIMTVLAIACGLAIPKINVNTDMTKYLPEDYPMKQGLTVMEKELPALQDQMREFGSIFADGNDLMPTDFSRTLAIGVGLLFLVLLIMSSSWMEVVLFLITTGFSVTLNMGTNALFPSVSMMTNTLSPVLQMVLSMDYCIILMNRYRQEKSAGKDPETAMQGAVGGAASSILSSAFTTIVSLMMLCFIKLKIGADLGLVLSKGVGFSLICNFTVLPFLILAGDKAVEATRKKVPVFPAKTISRLAYRFRYPLTALFLLVFVAFTYLQRFTPLSFSPQWESPALAKSSGENAALLIYPNSMEEAIPGLMDTLSSLPGVHGGISYPSLVQRRRTVGEMQDIFDEFVSADSSAISPELLSLVYYARFNPERTERMSFPEMMALVDELSSEGLIPEGFDYKLDLNALMASPEPVRGVEYVVIPEPVDTTVSTFADSTSVLAADSIRTVHPIDSVSVLPQLDSQVVVSPSEGESSAALFTYEEASTAWTAAEMSRLLDFNQRQISMLYRLAGRRNQKMTPKELFTFVREKILPDKRYSRFVSKELVAQVTEYEAQLDSILAAGPPVLQTPSDTLSMPDRTDDLSLQEQTDSLDVTTPADTLATVSVEEPEEMEEPPTPLEILAEMAFSSRKYSSARIHSALSAAGIAVSREQLDLLFLCSGARKGIDSTWRMSPEELLVYVADTLLTDPALSTFVPDSARTMITDARAQLFSGVGQLHGENYSGAVVLSGYPAESDSTFAFVDELRAITDSYLPQTHYWIGESEMYKELKDGFPDELLLLTLLTVLSIFIIVAITFRSVFIPIPLVMTIMSGIYVNIWASGLGGNTLYYLSYLIIQGILMGATIDYTILFTYYYRESRRGGIGISDALSAAYQGSSHSILTSGLILIIVPYLMSWVMDDPMISPILCSLSIGSLAIVTLILLVLPGVLAALDPLLRLNKPRG